MDRRTILSERALREALRRRPALPAPLFFTERVMRGVRAERQRRLCREHRWIGVLTGATIIAFLVGLWLLRRYFAALPETDAASPVEVVTISLAAAAVFLRKVQEVFRRRCKLPE